MLSILCLGITLTACARHQETKHFIEATKEKKPMTTPTLNLNDSDYFATPSLKVEPYKTQLADSGFLGVVLGAPSSIDLNKHDSFPLLALQRGDLENNSLLPFDNKAILLAVGLERNSVHIGPAIIAEDNTEELPPPGGPNIPGGGSFIPPPPKGSFIQTFEINIKEQLSIPWRTEEYLVTVILSDQQSNRVYTRLENLSGFKDSAVENYLTKIKSEPKHLNLTKPNEAPYPNYSRLQASPNIPQKGIALEAKRVNIISDELQLPIFGSFNLNALPRELIDKNKAPTSTLNLDTEIDAVIPITFLIVGSEDGFITATTLNMPAKRNDIYFSGHFSFDLLEVKGMSQRAQTYFVYPISGHILESPMHTALVSQLELP